MNTLAVDYEPLAVDINCTTDALIVVLEDGREVSVPLAWFPRLQKATPAQRKKWRLMGGVMRYLKADNRDFFLALNRELAGKC